MAWSNSIENRPSWDTYFLTLCFVVAQRSIDNSILCGAIIVDKKHRILSVGYNSPPAGSMDKNIPMTRPEKYCYIIHAEENAILNYFGSRQDLDGATIYVTGKPCHRCTRMIIQKGIRRIVYTGVNKAVCQDEEDLKAANRMIKEHEVDVRELDIVDKLSDLLDRTKTYINVKKNAN